MYCYHCGKALNEGETVCSNCGLEQNLRKERSLYDYINVKVDEYNKQLIVDSYDYFGYEPVSRGIGTLTFKRSRNIEHKVELSKLRFEADKIINKISKLERSKTSHGLTWGLIIGITGLLVFGSGLSMILTEMNLVVGYILAALGAIIAAPSYPVLKIVNDKNSYKATPEIDELMDYLNSLCEQAESLHEK